ncbi:DNA-binding response regulator, NarL/FixJ family, contains REC and HTH domains [Marinospirillum celere]|uniref:DNA-binding response regulator, NarL/FixJ family, contains REC and HTH domains n=1 Tax=Marinospirillum celere TaxID=1122252 RepID=A0A1I1EQA1_9GAMM|nr:response regulator [Marinospirillum celere]SFB88842.1 DNA-binding response regulator, NarL/FixJ family, contains REC and HTH domains [Marinospirillum celere]
MIRVLIVDDHVLVRTGIERILADAEGIEVIGQAVDGEEAISLTRELEPDIVLMDVKMPGIGGVEATRKICRAHPKSMVIGLTASGDDTFVQRLLQAGAKGYLTKGSSYEEVVRAIKLVASGQHYVDPTVASGLLVRDPNNTHNSNPFSQLSDREMQVAMMIVNCQKVQEIADSLFVSPRTVNTYRYRIFEKLDVRNDVELTHLALRHKLVDVTD